MTSYHIVIIMKISDDTTSLRSLYFAILFDNIDFFYNWSGAVLNDMYTA